MEKKKRPLSLSGAIINLVFAILHLVYTVLILLLIKDIFLGGIFSSNITLNSSLRVMATPNAGLYAFVEIVFMVQMLIDLAIIALSIVLISLSFKPVAVYKGGSVLIVILFIANIVSAISNMIFVNFISILFALVNIMCAVFIMVDLCRNNIEYKKLKQTPSQQQQSGCMQTNYYQAVNYNFQPVVYPTPQGVQNMGQNEASSNVNVAATENKNNMHKMQEDLLAIQKMKDEGVISEQEYQKLREAYIKNIDV